MCEVWPGCLLFAPPSVMAIIKGCLRYKLIVVDATGIAAQSHGAVWSNVAAAHCRHAIEAMPCSFCSLVIFGLIYARSLLSSTAETVFKIAADGTLSWNPHQCGRPSVGSRSWPRSLPSPAVLAASNATSFFPGRRGRTGSVATVVAAVSCRTFRIAGRLPARALANSKLTTSQSRRAWPCARAL